MLSYRHSFHAGNFADVLKHIVLVEIFAYLQQKPGGIDYIDTHAGAGLYDLHANDAQKLAEYQSGIAKIELSDFPDLSEYLSLIAAHNPSGNLRRYPGSPMLVKQLLREQDRAWLYELHPQDYKHLNNNMRDDRSLVVNCEDGLKGLLSKVPPKGRRAIVLIDPSYELKNEYDLVIETVIKAHKKFATGVYAIWYPVVDRSKILRMEKQLQKSGVSNVQCFELGLESDTRGRGMTSSGLLVINPPWVLMAKMQALLPRLAQQLSDRAVYRAEIICPE